MVQKKIIRYTDLPLQSSDLIEQNNSHSTSEANINTAVEPSEISTSTEDYVTATDSYTASYTTTPTQGPSVTSSSFDSESSKYSLPHPIFDHDVNIFKKYNVVYNKIQGFQMYFTGHIKSD